MLKIILKKKFIGLDYFKDKVIPIKIFAIGEYFELEDENFNYAYSIPDQTIWELIESQ